MQSHRNRCPVLWSVVALLIGLSFPVEARSDAVAVGSETGTIQGQVVPAGAGGVVPAGPGQVVSAGPGRGHWRTYGVPDGLGGAIVRAIFQDSDGYLWLSTGGGGVSRFDGETFVAFTGQDVDLLEAKTVVAIYQDRDGHMWFGGSGGGAVRYDGQTFTTFTTEDGLVHDRINAIVQDLEGNLWFGTLGGVSRYDGQTWTSFTTEDGLADNLLYAIIQDREGYLWFATAGGASRYDGQTWTTFTTEEILSRMLTQIGVEVTVAVNGREAIERIKSEVPDITFLDIRMPEMDGSQVAQWIWQELGRDQVKVVAVSASALDHERQQFLEAGFDRFIPKPVRAEQVYACLTDLLQVKYDYAATSGTDNAEAPALDWNQIRLPDRLLARLAEAAELHSVTELGRHLREMEALGADEQRHAAHLRDLSERYDMDGIRNILKDIRIV